MLHPAPILILEKFTFLRNSLNFIYGRMHIWGSPAWNKYSASASISTSIINISLLGLVLVLALLVLFRVLVLALVVLLLLVVLSPLVVSHGAR